MKHGFCLSILWRALIIVLVIMNGRLASSTETREPSSPELRQFANGSLDFSEFTEWSVSRPMFDRVLLTHKTKKVVVLVNEYPTTLTPSRIDAYFQLNWKDHAPESRAFALVNETGLPRNPISRTAKRFGILHAETSIDAPFESETDSIGAPSATAYLEERLWADQGRVWQISLGSYDRSPLSPDEMLSFIDEVEKSILRQRQVSLFKFLIPEARAVEVLRAAPKSSLLRARAATAPACGAVDDLQQLKNHLSVLRIGADCSKAKVEAPAILDRGPSV